MTEEKTYSLLSKIGNTPLMRLRRVLPKDLSGRLEVYAKAEWFNPGGSVKDRPAYRMVRDAMADGRFRPAKRAASRRPERDESIGFGPGQSLIDSTSGNTGIAYAMIGAAMGFPVELVMPRNVSRERKKIVEAFGAKIIYSDPLKGSDGARDLVHEIVSAKENTGRYFFPDQYSNPSNWKAHYETTGPEIWQATQGRITHFVAGMGTSGTLMGTSRFLKEKNERIQVIAVQPEAFHGIEGLKNMDCSSPVGIYQSKFHDRKLTIPTEPAYEWTRRLASEEGIFAGPSAGAALYGALTIMRELEKGVVVFVCPDAGDKYLSTQLWES